MLPKVKSRSLLLLLVASQILLALSLSASLCFAADIVRIIKPYSEKDRRHLYHHALLSAALEKTVAEFGDYRIEYTSPGMQRRRSLVELLSGKYINVDMVPTQTEWEEKALPIRIPLHKGLPGYRLFLIRKDRLESFSRLSSLAELQVLRAGLRQQWSITKVMEALGFRVVKGSNYEGLFRMLMAGRFDYFPRGVNEIFLEIEARRDALPEMVIEPTKALFLPLPYYVFVCPKYPQLAKRIELGLTKMIEDGSFDTIFWTYNASFIQRAKLSERQIFSLNNPFLPAETPLNEAGFWFDPSSKPPPAADQ